MSRASRRRSNNTKAFSFSEVDSLTSNQHRRLNKKVRRSMAAEGSIAEDILQFERAALFKLEPKTQGQAELIYGLDHYQQVIAFGPAGTGKTFVVAAYAAKLFLQKKIDKIIITRPNVPTGRSIGLFPGDVNQKMQVWLQPVISVLKRVMGKGVYDTALANEQIIYQPLETIRGQSFDDAFIIIDECQNIDTEEVKAVVTRVGENTTIVFSGDICQKDIKGESGLEFILRTIRNNEKLSAASYVVEFDSEDVVRSKLCKLWVEVLNGI